jgi:hypothetical protein
MGRCARWGKIIMQRLLIAALLLSACAGLQAQTTINVTLPNSTACTYTTGPITSNPAVPGQLLATASGLTGTGCGGGGSGSGGVNFGPASPLLPATQSIASATTGESASLSFQPVNATSCSGSISPSTGTTYTGSCNSASACSTAQSVTATFPYNASTTTSVNYTVTASCVGAGSQTPVTSQAAVTVKAYVPVGSGSCPAVIPGSTGSIASYSSAGKLPVFYYGITGGLRSTDTTLFSVLYEETWPGVAGQNLYISMPTNQYVSAAFTVPTTFFTAAGAPALNFGDYTITQSAYSAPISMTISTVCGDFAPPSSGSTVVSGCYVDAGTTSNNTFLQWRNSGSCTLTAGSSYYLNIINADVSGLTAGGGGKAVSTSTTAACPANVCTDPIQNGPGAWTSWNGTDYLH